MSETNRRTALTAAAALLALFCAAGLWRVLAPLGLHVPLDPNEGWNAYHAMAAMGAGPLYPGPQSFMVNNYPPLSFYIVGAVGAMLGDDIVAGRIVSLIALAALAAGLFAAARKLGCRNLEAAFAPLLFAGGLLVFTDYAGMDDPQLLAHAVAMAGFLLLLREPRETTTVAAAALLFVLAAFVKHNVVAMPVAMMAWLVWSDRRSALRLALFGLGFLLAGLVIFRLVYGTGLLSQLVSPRTYSAAGLRAGLEAWLAWGLVPLIGLVILAGVAWNDLRVRLIALYAIAGIVLGTAFLGGAGVDTNVMFDADLALALGAALAFDRLQGALRPALGAGAYALPLIFGLWINSDWHDAANWRHPLRDDAELAQQDIVFLEARHGPALCEMLSLCYWAHKPASVDVFNVGEQFAAGARRDATLVGLIEAQHFSVIQFDPDSPHALGGDVDDAVARHYRLDHSDDDGVFYVPR